MKSFSKSKYFFIFLVFPQLLIETFPKNYEWIARVFVLALVFAAALFFLARYGVSPKSKFILEGGKLNNPGYEKTKKYVEKFMRASVLMFTFFLLYLFVVPFAVDVFFLTSGTERPLRFHGKVLKNTTTFGAWFISQRLKVVGEVSTDGYYTLLYSLKPRLSKNKVYEFTALKRSKLILDQNECKLINSNSLNITAQPRGGEGPENPPRR